MPRPPKTWLISDTHWYHAKMPELCGRPENFGDIIRKNLRQIGEADTLIHLGDVIFYKYPELKDILAEVKGRKILVKGNHDSKNHGWYMRNGFDFSADLIMIGDIVFTHRPLEVFPSGATMNIHGHLHNTTHRVYEWLNPDKHLLFTLEHHYSPIELHQFIAQKRAKEIKTTNGDDFVSRRDFLRK